jgi:hypothetical protein
MSALSNEVAADAYFEQRPEGLKGRARVPAPKGDECLERWIVCVVGSECSSLITGRRVTGSNCPSGPPSTIATKGKFATGLNSAPNIGRPVRARKFTRVRVPTVIPRSRCRSLRVAMARTPTFDKGLRGRRGDGRLSSHSAGNLDRMACNRDARSY